jgi:hypothetical protein
MAKPKKSKLSSEEEKQISDLISQFIIVNEGVASLYGRSNERKWARYLLLKYGGYSEREPDKTKIHSMIEFIPKYNKSLKKKWGTIKKPSELVTFLSDLIEYKKKYDLDILYKKNQREKEEADKKYYEEQKRIINEMPEEEKQRLAREKAIKSEEFKKKLRGF